MVSKFPTWTNDPRYCPVANLDTIKPLTIGIRVVKGWNIPRDMSFKTLHDFTKPIEAEICSSEFLPRGEAVQWAKSRAGSHFVWRRIARICRDKVANQSVCTALFISAVRS